MCQIRIFKNCYFPQFPRFLSRCALSWFASFVTKGKNQCWLVAQYNCLEFQRFASICFWKCSPFATKKTYSHFQFRCYFRFYIWNNLMMVLWIFVLLNMCTPRILALLVSVSGADSSFLIIAEPNLEIFLAGLRKLFKRV